MADENKLIIELRPDGKVFVSGPITNKMFCYGLLECAKDAIREFASQNASEIVVPPPLALRQ